MPVVKFFKRLEFERILLNFKIPLKESHIVEFLDKAYPSGEDITFSWLQ